MGKCQPPGTIRTELGYESLCKDPCEIHSKTPRCGCGEDLQQDDDGRDFCGICDSMISVNLKDAPKCEDCGCPLTKDKSGNIICNVCIE